MATLEQYVAEATNAYAPAKTAVQTQLDALGGDLATAQETINRNYAQQQSQLENQRNQAAEASSLAAAGSGGSFGGQGNIARRKYYEQSFVPAQTQLQTNQANELANAQRNYENQRTSLNAQLANLDAQANQAALQQYWSALEAEKSRQAQIAAAKASNPYQYMDDGYSNSDGSGTRKWDFGNGYVVYDDGSGNAVYTRNGQQIYAGHFLSGTGAGRANWDMWNDMWNNGLRTNGVGSDTVQAYNGVLNGMVANNSGKYNYLWGK